MSKKFGKDDILAFLNAKFAKAEQPKKRDQKEQEKRSSSEKPKETAPKQEERKSTSSQSVKPQGNVVRGNIQEAFRQVQLSQQVINDEKMYQTMQELSVQQKTECLNQFKQTQLKNPQNYDQELKNKIFFIGQNALNLNQQVGVAEAGQELTIKQKVISNQRKN